MHALSTEDVHEEDFGRDSSAHWSRFTKGRSEHWWNDKSASISWPYWEQSAEQMLTDTMTNHFVMNTMHFSTALFFRKLHFKEWFICLNGHLMRFLLWCDSFSKWLYWDHTWPQWESESTLNQFICKKWLKHRPTMCFGLWHFSQMWAAEMTLDIQP